MNTTQPEQIILISPSHEQSAPTFQMIESLKESFLRLLESEGIETWRDPTELEKNGPNNEKLVQVEVDPKQPISKLEGLLKKFEARAE